MKASQFIKDLRELISMDGDLEVVGPDGESVMVKFDTIGEDDDEEVFVIE